MDTPVAEFNKTGRSDLGARVMWCGITMNQFEASRLRAVCFWAENRGFDMFALSVLEPAILLHTSDGIIDSRNWIESIRITN